MRAAWVFPGLCLALAIGAQAQQPAERRRERTSVMVVPQRELYKVFPGNRGKMGITVSIDLEPTDSIGALVEAVTPAGPAYRGGIRTGDVITTLNGRSLVQATRESRKPTPGLVLIELATQMEAGDTARIEYRRGHERRRVNVVLEPIPVIFEEPAFAQGYEYRTPLDGPDIFFDYDDRPPFDPNTPGGSMMFLRTRVMYLELAPMNPALGQYFGVAEGVLVINVPEGSRLNLRPGDVVLAVDGRTVSNPNQMFRVLLSYEGGEGLRFDVMRMKRRESFTGSMTPTP